MTQDGDPQAKKEEESLPEVEAELVSETPSPEDAFEDDAPEASPSPDAVQGDAGDGPSSDAAGKRKSTLTPGVMLFLAFVVVALIAFGVWRFQLNPEDKISVEEAAPVAQETAPTTPAPQEETGTAAESETASDPAPEVEEPPRQEAKIDNLAKDDLAPPPAGDAMQENGAESSGFLPPVTEAGAAKIANSVEEGAKDAMRRDEEAEGAPGNRQPTDDAVEGAGADALAADNEGAESAEADLEEAPSTELQEDAPEAAAQEAAAEEQASLQPSEDDTVADNEPGSDAAPVDNAPIEDEAVALQSEMESMRAAFEEERADLTAALDSARRINNEQNTDIRDLRAQLDAARAREAALKDEVAAMRSELSRVRREGVTMSQRSMKASFAVAALSRAVDQGEPFTQELAAVAEFEPGAEAALEAHAETGVATDAALRIGFDAAARKALAAAGQAEAGGGISGIVARAKNLVSVRPARPLDGDDPGAILSRAEHALEEGELEFALLQLEDLPLPAQEAMSEWMAAARARVEAKSAVAALTVRIAGEGE
ncbi:COG4223 family protein [Hyphococcus sp.]|uniref:COG4223 family protein n=1 Tax=Hyphococcus sp. TaxID=2038636 RepID=UPI0035C6CFAD